MKPGKNFKVQGIQCLSPHTHKLRTEIILITGHTQKSSAGSGPHPHTYTICAGAKCVQWGEVRLKVLALFTGKDQKHSL